MSFKTLQEMYPFEKFLLQLNKYLTGNTNLCGNIIRKHSKKLEQLGDVSFPLDIKKWSLALNKAELERHVSTIFDYLRPFEKLPDQLESLIKLSETWTLPIDRCVIKDNSDIHLYLRRFSAIQTCIQQVLAEEDNYGLQFKYFDDQVNVITDDFENDVTKMSLTDLRMMIIQNVTTNILSKLTSETSKSCDIRITVNSNEKLENVLMCGSILNEEGVKDVKTTADDFYKKRSLDLQLMAQHKYGVQLKASWREYFDKLGKASVIMEMLQNRTHKATKITLNDLQTTNKGPSFILYNCARLNALLKQFEEHVLQHAYPALPSIKDVDFTLLTQKEEWEIVYVYILQFPTVVVNCVADITRGVVNLHHLILFLSNLSSIFSVYYRRIKILTSPKEHLLPTMYARIFLIKAVQQVFHTSLGLLNIEPVRKM